MRAVILIALFGSLGVLARYLLDRWVGVTTHGFPLSTFLINVFGSFLIGVVYVGGIEKAMWPLEIAQGVTVGFLGGFTTFSAYALQVTMLAGEGSLVLASVYALASPILAIAFAFAGSSLARILL
jgi:fluoride exporter